MGSGQSRQCPNSLARLLEYDTPLVLRTSSKTIGIIFRFLQVAIFIFVYYIGYNRGYQLVSYQVTSATRIIRKDATKSVADEIGIPVHDKQNDESRVFYPTTAVMIMQNKSICPEEPSAPLSQCDPRVRDPCPPLTGRFVGNGIRTGNCVPVRRSEFTYHEDVSHTCEINGWCTQTEQIQENIVGRFYPETLSILVENEVHFPQFPTRRNINNHAGNSMYCWSNGHFYHSKFHPLCPVFDLEIIIREAVKAPGAIPFTYEQLARTGGLISIQLKYDCNLDVRDPAKQCKISYEFRRLDEFENRTVGSKIPDISYTHHVAALGERVIIHMHGITLIVLTEGVARQFDVFTFLTRIGASVGLFALAAVFCELLLTLACCPTEKQTRNMKYVTSDSKILVNL